MATAIDAGLAPSVRQLAAEYGAAKKQIEAALAFFPDAAAELEEFASSHTKQLDAGCRALIDMLREAEQRTERLMAIQDCAAIVDEYKQGTQQALDAYMAKTARQRYAKEPHYTEFHSRVWEVHGEGAMPPLIDLIPAGTFFSGAHVEPGDACDGEASDGEDIVMGGTMQQFRCPLTASLLVDAMQRYVAHMLTVSTVCPHAYSRAAVLEYLGTSASAKCPAASCAATITKRTLRDAPSLQRRVDRHERIVARRGPQDAVAAVLE
ncbi:hypothetical protein MVES_002555 [Malassezia vespertilionis]|uniref:SP-RING-type domain-containing protein n=1 Tax=Malassezia vespertilionis TaxID=2020962 RepID=A0A2N1JAZ1_9BASI|nr:hypothetical protein MVES_002555 [Malassezia vespertilionis]